MSGTCKFAVFCDKIQAFLNLVTKIPIHYLVISLKKKCTSKIHYHNSHHQ